MEITPRISRQGIGCGYEPPAPIGVPVRPWDHSGRHEDRDVDPPSVCPGYSCGLPEVIEASHARMHWQKGELVSFTRKPPRPELMTAITILELESNRAEGWEARQKQRKERS